MPGRAKWLALTAIGASGFLSTVNASAVVTVLPIIQQELGADIVTIGLTLTIYQLIAASLMLAFGRLGDLRGQRRIFLIGFAIFIAGSALCGLASRSAGARFPPNASHTPAAPSTSPARCSSPRPSPRSSSHCRRRRPGA
ncbi:MAG: MFS transporter [Candidatus Limnocylindria bacterium]